MSKREVVSITYGQLAEQLALALAKSEAEVKRLTLALAKANAKAKSQGKALADPFAGKSREQCLSIIDEFFR